MILPPIQIVAKQILSARIGTPTAKRKSYPPHAPRQPPAKTFPRRNQNKKLTDFGAGGHVIYEDYFYFFAAGCSKNHAAAFNTAELCRLQV